MLNARDIELSNKFEVESMIFKTDKYELFKGSEGNRVNFTETPSANSKKNIEDKIKSIRKDGLTYPIIVKEDKSGGFVILDGHHRFLALKELGMPIKFMIKNNMTLGEAIESSNSSSKWTKQDDIISGSTRGFELCKLIQCLINKFQHEYVSIGAIISSSLRIARKIDNNFPTEDKFKKIVGNFNKEVKNCNDDNNVKALVNPLDCEIKDAIIKGADCIVEFFKIYKETEEDRKKQKKKVNNTLTSTSTFPNAFGECFIEIKDVDLFLNNWRKVSKCKNEESRLIYEMVTSSNMAQVKNGLKLLTINKY